MKITFSDNEKRYLLKSLLDRAFSTEYCDGYRGDTTTRTTLKPELFDYISEHVKCIVHDQIKKELVKKLETDELRNLVKNQIDKEICRKLVHMIMGRADEISARLNFDEFQKHVNKGDTNAE